MTTTMAIGVGICIGAVITNLTWLVIRIWEQR